MNPLNKSTYLFSAIAVLFLILSSLAWTQATNSRQVYRKNGLPTKTEWAQAESIPFSLGTSGRLYDELYVPFSGRYDNTHVVPTLDIDIPRKPFGYVLHLGTRQINPENPPVLTASINGEYLDEFQVQPYYWPERDHGRDCNEIFIPEKLLTDSEHNRLLVRSTKGNWFGRILLVPYGRWRPFIQLLLPLTGALLLLSCSTFSGARWDKYPSIIVFSVLFLVYFYTLFTMKMAPTDGFFWDDSTNYIQAVINNTFEFKAAKHILLFPTMHIVFKGMDALLGRDLVSLSAAFSFIAALNGAIAYRLFQSRFKDNHVAMMLTVIYGFSFSIWVFSSLFESYILPSLLVNLFLLSILLMAHMKSRWRFVPPSLLIVLAGLSHPPLLILIALLWAHLFSSKQRTKARVGLAVTLTIFVVIGFLCGRILIRSLYPEPSDGNYIGQVSFAGEVAFAGDTIARYSSLDHLTFSNVGNVILGQFVYAFGGFPYAFKWYKGWRGILDYFHSPQGAIFISSFGFLWAAAAASLRRCRQFRNVTFFLLLAAALPYALFYWYFNPQEMILYSAPAASIVLLWLATGARHTLQEHFGKVLLTCAVSTVLLNTISLVSYR